ncbi:amphi-Trp domain-containing protein [Haloferax sp. S1W]|uniref:amphi-Trp domain-containing protein n=1 Tax=Haloferax sp. S1W TaxID=3377110 RepID=UPI0037C53F92
MNKFELEREETRGEVASYLRTLADGLEQGDKMTFVAGDDSTTINPPETVHFKLETDTDSSWLGGENGRSFRIELGWEADEVNADEELAIINQPRTVHREEEVES